MLWRHILPAVERTFRRYDLTYLDFTVLETLRAADGRALPAGHLASVAGVTSSRLSHRLAALESQGDVLRRQAHGDGRVVEVVITDAGADRLERALPDHVADMRRLVFDELTVPDSELFASLLIRITGTLESPGPSVPRAAPSVAPATPVERPPAARRRSPGFTFDPALD